MSRKDINKIYLIVSLTSTVTTILSFILYLKFKSDIVTLLTSIIILLWAVFTFYFVYKKWFWFVEDLINEYTAKNNLFSGVLAVILMFFTVSFLPNILSHFKISMDISNFQSVFGNISIAAMTSIIGILGVQYTIAIQEKNRKEDLRYGAKPYLLVSCFCKKKIISNDSHEFNRFVLQTEFENISQNIAIPIGCKLTKEESELYTFKYIPMNNGAKRIECVEIDNQQPITPKCSIDFYYKDVLNNIYKQTITFEMHDGIEMSNCNTINDSLCLDEEKKLIISYLSY